jgi:hypothetical protein
MTVKHHSVPRVNGSIRGRGINLRSLTSKQREKLAVAANQGELTVSDLTLEQAAAVFRVPPSRIRAALRIRQHEATPVA